MPSYFAAVQISPRVIRQCYVEFLFSIKYQKPRRPMRFFHLNFLNASGILAHKTCNACTIFPEFSNFKNGGQSQQSSVLDQLVTSEPQRTGISRSKES